jgi:hypothetical protein
MLYQEAGSVQDHHDLRRKRLDRGFAGFLGDELSEL